MISYAIVTVYKEPVKRPVEEAVADLLNRSLTIDSHPRESVSIGSGEEYEVIGVDLGPRPLCPRGNTLIYKFKNYFIHVFRHNYIYYKIAPNLFNCTYIFCLNKNYNFVRGTIVTRTVGEI